MRYYPSTERNILSFSLGRRIRYISTSRIPPRPVFQKRSVSRSRFCSRCSSLLRFHCHRARICAGICHYCAPSTSCPHQYHLPLHNGLHVHLHSFDSTHISLVGLDICSVITQRPLDLERYYQQFLQLDRSSLSTTLSRIATLVSAFHSNPLRPPGLGGPIVLVSPTLSLVVHPRLPLNLQLSSHYLQ